MLELNKIHLGDSYELIKQIPDKSIDCVYIDVPYKYINGGVSESELGDRFSKKRKSLKDMNIYDGFSYELFNDLFRIMKKVNIFVWCSRLQLIDVMNIFNEKGYSYELLTWNKTNPQPGVNNTWLSDIEYCLYFREKGVPLNNGYELKSKWFTSSLNMEDKNNYNHPTIKPLDLVKRHLLHTTQPNDVVLDCFSGSGTTCVACKEIGRQFIGIEIDEKWHKISVDRLNGINAKGQTSIFTDFDNML